MFNPLYSSTCPLINSSFMACSLKGKKVEDEAMKKYKRAKFVYNLVLYSLTSLITCSFFTYSFWFPSVYQLLSWDFLNDISCLFDAKYSFMVANLIILVLIRESKMESSCSSAPTSDFYSEYIARSHGNYHHKATYSKEANGLITRSLSLQEKNHVNGEDRSSHEEKKKKKKITKEVAKGRENNSVALKHQELSKKKGMMRSCKSESEIAKKEEKFLQGEEVVVIKDYYMGNEELNKRVEDFIARINKQRSLEAKLMENDRG